MDLKTYNKKSLVKKVSSKLNMSKSESIILVDCVLDSFKEIFFEYGNQKRIERFIKDIFKEVGTPLSNINTKPMSNDIAMLNTDTGYRDIYVIQVDSNSIG